MRIIRNLLLVLGVLQLTCYSLCAQNIDYLAKAKEFLYQGDCERAEYAYQDYKKSHPAGNGEVERRIKECKQHYCPSTLSDFEGNNYHTVRIGDQCWMSENLRTVFTNDGKKLSEDVFFPPDGKKSNVSLYGYLYDWYGAMVICPNGWHLPSSDEWRQLIGACEAIGELAGGARGTWIESSGKTGYKKGYPGDYNYAYRNRTGFNAIPAGEYCWQGPETGGWDYERFGYTAYFWTSSGSGMDEEEESFFSMGDRVWFPYEMEYSNCTPLVMFSFKSSCCSVRCIKD